MHIQWHRYTNRLYHWRDIPYEYTVNSLLTVMEIFIFSACFPGRLLPIRDWCLILKVISNSKLQCRQIDIVKATGSTKTDSHLHQITSGERKLKGFRVFFKNKIFYVVFMFLLRRRESFLPLIRCTNYKFSILITWMRSYHYLTYLQTDYCPHLYCFYQYRCALQVSSDIWRSG